MSHNVMSSAQLRTCPLLFAHCRNNLLNKMATLLLFVALGCFIFLSLSFWEVITDKAGDDEDVSLGNVDMAVWSLCLVYICWFFLGR